MKISLFVPITRWWALNQLFDGLNKQELNDQFTIEERIFYIDTDNERTIEGVRDYAEPKDKIIISGNPEPPSLKIKERRDRITAMKNDSRKHISGITDYVISIEDDTILPENAFIKLTDIARRNENLGIASGVQVGRWGAKMIGAWAVDNLENPTRYITLPYTNINYLEEIDGAGMYCYITPTTLYKEFEYYWVEPVGCDVSYGLDLKRKGYKNLLDWSLICGHNDFGKILYPDDKCCQVLLSNNWEQKVL